MENTSMDFQKMIHENINLKETFVAQHIYIYRSQTF